MGKKSRKNKPCKTPAALAAGRGRSGGTASPSLVISSTTSADAFDPSFTDGAAAKIGWAQELHESKKSLRNNLDDPDAVLRAARAARVMRQFDSLEKIITKAEGRGVAIDGADDRALLLTFQDKIAAHKAQTTRVDDPNTAGLLRRVMNEDVSIDSSTFEHPTYAGLSALQYAACTSDVPLLEQLVAVGAALDFEHVPPSPRRVGRTTVAKPPGCTALLMAVASAICARAMVQFEPLTWRTVYEGAVECAIQLVRLGASVDVIFRLPPGRDGKSDTYAFFRMENLVGKSIKEMAPHVGSELLMQTIEELDSDEGKFRLVNCRCGSRLPWKQCHAARKTDSYYGLDNGGKIRWRFSPLAPCPCKNTNKTYYKCCWDDQSYRVYNQDDVTSDIRVSITQPLNNAHRTAMAAIHKGGGDYRSAIESFTSQTPEDVMAMKIRMIRQGGPDAISYMISLSKYAHPKTRMGEYDPDVYAGTMEQMDAALAFDWIDVHWSIPKPELLKRVDEWNEALGRYCDSTGLCGADRDAVVEKNRASPYAPCANMKCNIVETQVKQFAVCSRCRHVAYCSRACQREDYKAHKVDCMKR